MEGGKRPPRPVFTHLGRGPGLSGVGRKTYLRAGGPEPAAFWREGSGGSCVQAEGVARRALAGGNPDGLSHFLLGFLTSEPGVGAGGERR